jgi:hypothetical protein
MGMGHTANERSASQRAATEPGAAESERLVGESPALAGDVQANRAAITVASNRHPERPLFSIIFPLAGALPESCPPGAAAA